MAGSGEEKNGSIFPEASGMKPGPSTSPQRPSGTESLTPGIPPPRSAIASSILIDLGLESSSSLKNGGGEIEVDTAGSQDVPVVVETPVEVTQEIMVIPEPTPAVTEVQSSATSASNDIEGFQIVSRTPGPEFAGDSDDDSTSEDSESSVEVVKTPVEEVQTPEHEDVEIISEPVMLRRSQRIPRTPTSTPVERTSVEGPSTRRRTRSVARIDTTESPVEAKRLRFDPIEASSSQAHEDVGKFIVGELYLDQESVRRGLQLRDRAIIPERPINIKAFNKYGLVEHLFSQGLQKTVTGFYPYSVDLVKEFYANLKMDTDVETSPHYHSVYVRGIQVPFSPSLITQFYELPTEPEHEDLPDDELVIAITNGEQVEWEVPGTFKIVRSKFLTSKHAVLYKVGISDWFPTRHQGEIDVECAGLLHKICTRQPVDLGSWIFNRILGIVKSPRQLHLIFPCLISSFILGTTAIDLSDDVMGSPEGEIYVHHKLLEPPHYLDLEEQGAGDIPIVEGHAEEEADTDADQFTDAAILGGSPVTITEPGTTVTEPGASVTEPLQPPEPTYDSLIANVDARVAASVALEAALTEQVMATRTERRELGKLRLELIKLRDARRNQ